MQDIARECGLSMMTVSRVLRGHKYVSAATRDRVMQAAARMDYQMNTLAQNFARRRSGIIGVAAPFPGLVGSHYFGELLQGFLRVLEADYQLSFFDIASPLFNEGRKLEKLYRTRKVDGLLVVAPSAEDKFLDTFNDLQIPLVVVGKTVTNPGIFCVGCDDYAGVTAVCEHLYALGHRRMAFVGGPTFFSVAQRREQAYREFCHRKKLKLPEHFTQRGDYSMRSGREAGLALLQAVERPTAILTANDIMAFGVLESTRQLHLEIPRDVSLAGFDDLPTAEDRSPALTTVHQPVKEMAVAGAQALLDWIQTEEKPGPRVILPTRLMVRESTGQKA